MTETFQAYEFHKDDNEIEQKDYVIISSEKEIWRKRYLTMISDYSEEQTIEKIKNLKKKRSFHYQAGDHAAFNPSKINFESNTNKFSVKQRADNVSILRGCPLIVVFSHNQCFAIGMFQSQTEGYLFN